MKEDELAFPMAMLLVVDNAGEQRKSIEEVYRLIQKHCQEFRPELRQAMTIAAQQDCKWDRPPLEYVKVNFYASFITENRDGAYGYVIRSDTGDFIAAGGGQITPSEKCFTW
jgi:predicted DNA-binding transcriptional regulator YafY